MHHMYTFYIMYTYTHNSMRKKSCVVCIVCVFTVYIYYVYINISDFKVNALTQIHFNGTHFINARLTQHEFSVWPVAQPIIGEMEMHSVANLVTLQTLLATFFPFKKASKPYLVWESPSTAAWVRGLAFTARTHSLSLSLSWHSLVSLSLMWHTLSLYLVSVQRTAAGKEEQRFNSVKYRYYFACFSNFTWCKQSRNHSTSYCHYLMCIWFHKTTAQLSGFLCRLTSWKGEVVIYSMNRVSITISYSFRLLTTETVKYKNENSFIENLFASKYSTCAQRDKQML